MPNSERAVLRAVHVRCDLDLLEPCGSTLTIERDAELCQPGAVADSCWRVVSGCLRRFELLDDGRRHVNAFLLPGDFFGFDDPEKRLFGVEAVTTTTLRG